MPSENLHKLLAVAAVISLLLAATSAINGVFALLLKSREPSEIAKIFTVSACFALGGFILMLTIKRRQR